MIENARILLTGPTSQVAAPLARALAREHRVTGVARFSDGKARRSLEEAGVTCVALDLATDDLDALPRDFDYLLHFAVVKTGDFDHDLAANVEGLGRLLSHCRGAKALLHCSSGGVYAPPGHTPARETDPLGDNHRPVMPTYSICKIAAEAMARFAAREYGLPTTIARFSVPYGNNGGWPWYHLMMMRGGVPIPVHVDAPNLFNPIHEDDYIAQVPRLLEIASVPATIVNWAGTETVSIEEWCAYLGELTGLEPKLAPTPDTIPPLPLDTTRLRELVGGTQVHWRDGIRRLVEARNPELLRAPPQASAAGAAPGGDLASPEDDAEARARQRELTERARERHDALTAAIDRLERALAAPAAQRAKPWSQRVATELELVREAIRVHVEDVEEPDGLLEKVESAAPRLSRHTGYLRQEHAALAERASRLAGRLPGEDDADFGTLRREAAGLLASLRAHRAAEADLVYEAFWLDLGAGD